MEVEDYDSVLDTDYIWKENSKRRISYMAKQEIKKEVEETIDLPNEVTDVETDKPPRDLVIVGIPKIGKGSILGDFTTKYNALVWGLEKGGYEYIKARKLENYTTQETTRYEAYQNFIRQRKALLDNKGKYDYLIIDGLSDLDDLSEIGGTLLYMGTIIGKAFNRVGGIKDGEKLPYGHPDFRSVLTLADGAGYQYTRKWFLEQVEIFKQISPYRIYAAHVADKYIKENGKEEVTGTEIALTGQLKRIFSGKVTSMAKIIADGDERYLNFEVLNDSILAGSRAPKLEGKILISNKEKNGKIVTFWDKIYK